MPRFDAFRAILTLPHAKHLLLTKLLETLRGVPKKEAIKLLAIVRSVISNRPK